MKATLKFNLDDNEDAMRHLRCIKSLDMSLALFEIVSVRRRIEKMNMKDEDRFDAAFERILEILEDSDINVDRLVL